MLPKVQRMCRSPPAACMAAPESSDVEGSPSLMRLAARSVQWERKRMRGAMSCGADGLETALERLIQPKVGLGRRWAELIKHPRIVDGRWSTELVCFKGQTASVSGLPIIRRRAVYPARLSFVSLDWRPGLGATIPTASEARLAPLSLGALSCPEMCSSEPKNSVHTASQAASGQNAAQGSPTSRRDAIR